MSFDVPSTPHASSEPTKEGVKPQIDKICQSDFFKGELRPHLLRFLVRKKFEGFFQRRPRPGRKELCDDFYNWAKDELGIVPPGDITTAGRKLLGDLTHALGDYYRDPECDDEIMITIPGGKGTLPEPQVTWRALSLSPGSGFMIDSKDEPAGGSIYRKLMDLPVHLYHLTRDADGKPVWYYNSFKVDRKQDGTLTANVQLRQPSSSKSPGISEYTYEFALAENRGHLIVSGGNIDGSPDITVQMFPHVGSYHFPWCGASIITRTLYQDSAASVSILSDRRLECVADAEDGEAISDPAKMRALRAIWKGGARRIGLSRISQTGEILPKGKWDISTIIQLLKEYAERQPSDASSKNGDRREQREVRIWTSFFGESFDMESVFSDLVRGGVTVRVLMMNPDNHALVRAKYRLREAEAFNAERRASEHIRDQIAQFKKLAKELSNFPGTLIVNPCDSIPFGVFFQIGNEVMLVGYLLPSDSWRDAPLLKYFPWSDQWDIFQGNWEICWKNPLDNTAQLARRRKR